MLQNAVSLSYLSDVKMNTGHVPVFSCPVLSKLSIGSCTKKRTARPNIELLATLSQEENVELGIDYTVNQKTRH